MTLWTIDYIRPIRCLDLVSVDAASQVDIYNSSDMYMHFTPAYFVWRTRNPWPNQLP